MPAVAASFARLAAPEKVDFAEFVGNLRAISPLAGEAGLQSVNPEVGY
jgi:hypothetical protein